MESTDWSEAPESLSDSHGDRPCWKKNVPKINSRAHPKKRNRWHRHEIPRATHTHKTKQREKETWSIINGRKITKILEQLLTARPAEVGAALPQFWSRKRPCDLRYRGELAATSKKNSLKGKETKIEEENPTTARWVRKRITRKESSSILRLI